MKIIDFWLKNHLATLIAMLVQFQSSYFFHKINSKALPLGDVLLDRNKSS